MIKTSHRALIFRSTARELCRGFSSSTSVESPEVPVEKEKSSILHIEISVKHCSNELKKFDFYAYVAGHYMPKSQQKYYYGYHAYFLEIMKSREISREPSICQTRLKWWLNLLKDVQAGKQAKEPVTVVLKDALVNTNLNANLLSRMADFQLFDIDRGDI